MNGLIIDLFAGGGGASLGIEAALGRKIDIAINHDAVALAVHKANHPDTLHVEEDIWKADPLALTGGRPVELLWASPDCTHFSVAKGGKPRSAKKRTLAGAVIRWARATKPQRIHLENVREFQGWGPLTKKGYPDKRKVGQSFRRWVRGLQLLGYDIDWRTLDASLYGAPTRRRRLFITARRDGLPIIWPLVTHGDIKNPVQDLFATPLKPLHTAAECIDWSLPCPSIFERKKPLAEKTLWRIAQGMKRFVIDAAAPFIVKVNHGIDAKTGRREYGLDEPLSTVTASGNGHALVTPFVAGVGGRAGDTGPTGGDEPVGTITAKNDRVVVAPSLIKFRGDSTGASLEDPMPTITAGPKVNPAGAPHALGIVTPVMITIDHSSSQHGETRADAPLPTTTVENRHALVAPTLIQTGYGEREGQAARAPGLDKPLGTVVAGGQKHALVAAFIEKGFSDRGGKVVQASKLTAPLPTVTTQDHNNLAAATLLKLRGTNHGADMNEPMPTVTSQGLHLAEVRAFLTCYYGVNGKGDNGQPLTDPMRTLTTKDRLGLVTVRGVDYAIVDIGMRMLEPHELLRAQFGRFAARYDLSVAKTKTAKVRLIGDSVCPEIAEAIVLANVPAAVREAAA
jgi:DNA (cytosine-5)-methyltransferase 1